MTIQDSIANAKITGPLSQTDGATVFEFIFPVEDPAFIGHFPNHPLLPGIFQLEIARQASQWALDCALSIREIRKAKFQRPVNPAETLRLELKLTESGDEVRAQAGFSVEGQRAGETLMTLWRNA